MGRVKPRSVSEEGEQLVAELCLKPLKEAAMELPMSLNRWSEPVSDTWGTEQGSSCSRPVRVSLLSLQVFNHLGGAPFLKGHECDL